MRVRVAIVIAACLLAGKASASSILQVEGGGSASSPSVMMVPEPAPVASADASAADELVRVGPSVFAVGQPPAVSEESVAAVDGAAPAVLRGGVYGEALPAPVVEQEPVKELSRPAQRAKERAERRAIRDAIRFGEPLPKNAETQPETDEPATDQESGT